MVQEMPDIEHEIHESDRDKDLEPGWGLNHIQDPYLIRLRVCCRKHYGGREDKVKQSTVKNR